ncbi:hypothetical protein [Sphingopyxis sp. BE259]|nr:hypothetical protein [Sphingopyxis sp. BE259]MDR7227843.1 hypothetical protein [Sphingopyxis sp. BE259]
MPSSRFPGPFILGCRLNLITVWQEPLRDVANIHSASKLGIYGFASNVGIMKHGPTDMWNDDNAIYDDGEWITWTEISSHLERLEFQARFPNLDVDLVPIFQRLLEAAADYHELTGRHLQVYGDLGELYGAITYGIKPHRIYAQGSDGKLGNDFVEVKTITPFKTTERVTLNLKGNFSKVLIVKIDANFEVEGKLIDRKALPRTKRDMLCLEWADFPSSPHRTPAARS